MERSIEFWEFELATTSPSLFVTSSSSVNVLCAAFAFLSEHIVIKIKANRNLFVSVLSKGEVAKKALMERYATGRVIEDLQPLQNSNLPCNFDRVQLVQTGVLLCDNEEDFKAVRNEALLVLGELTDSEERSEVCFCQSTMLDEGEGIISQHITPNDADELIKNLFHLTRNKAANEDQGSNLSAIACGSNVDVLMPSTSAKANQLTSSMQSSNEYPIENLTLRDYQEELCEKALQRTNCIVVAPTGSGKTFVAAKICKEHVKNTPNARVVMLVPRVHLVKQQGDLFIKYLGNEIWKVSGESNTGIPSSYVKRHAVSVMTAQILFNILESKEMKIEDFSLLIFDECHHAMKDEVYNNIMRLYMDKKFSAEGASLRFPQIFGLTALPGVDKANSEEKAEEAIKTLMANLDVNLAPVQVTRCLSSLEYHQNEAKEEMIVIPRNYRDVFSNRIKGAMKEIEELMENFKENRFYNVVANLNLNCGASYESQAYEAHVVELLEESTLLKDKDASRWFRGFAIQLREYNTALVMNDHVTSAKVQDYLVGVFFNKSKLSDVDEKLQEIYDRFNLSAPADSTNPLLEKLRFLLIAQYNVKPESRSLVFVKTRAIAQALTNYLQEEPTIESLRLNPMMITGANAKPESLGMNLNQQVNNIKAFREGVCKVLVTTSVAEEGLDIEKCNLVVGYNYSTNEIGRVQRQGRGRAKHSKYLLLALEGYGHVEREEANKMRVELAYKMIKQIQKKNPVALKCEIQKLQQEAYKERMSLTEEKRLLCEEIEKDPPYQLLCAGCQRPVTTSDLFHHINGQHHTIVDSTFKQRATIRPYPKHTIKPDEFNTGKIMCGDPTCEMPWGTRMIYKEAAIYVLAIKNFVVTHENGYHKQIKKWKNAPFKVAIKPLDLKDYLERMLADGLVNIEDLILT